MMTSSRSKEDEGTNHHDAYDSDAEQDSASSDEDEGDDCDDLGKPTNPDPILSLRVKSSNHDLEIGVPSSSSVASVKQEVRRALRLAPNRYVRLIVRGRLLAPDSGKVAGFAKDGDVVHAVVAAEGQQGGAQALLANANLFAAGSSASGSLSRRALRGTGVSLTGQAVRSNEADDDETTEEDEEGGLGYSGSSSSNAAAALIRHRGFDRLRLTLGLRRSQVAILRAYFNPQIDRWVRNNPERARNLVQGIDDALLRRRIHEEAWMSIQGPGSEFRINITGGADGFFPATTTTTSPLFSTAGPGAPGARALGGSVGTDRDFFWGFVLGFFVGFLMLLWVWMPTVPHKQKLGILTGISFQLALSMMRSQDETDDSVLD